MKKIRHTAGDPAVTIRALSEIAAREGWDLDAQLSVDCEDETFYVRGAQMLPNGGVNLDLCHEDEWETIDADPQEARRSLDHLLNMQVVEGRIDPREADLLLEAIAHLADEWRAAS